MKQELLGVTIDFKPSVEEHVDIICKTASQKLNALARIFSYLDIPKRQTIFKLFITSQFGYCPLVWMFHSRKLNNKRNAIYERNLRKVYGDGQSTFEQLLEKDNSVSIHQRNLLVLATKMFKISTNLSP